jgi:hypothetical protein
VVRRARRTSASPETAALDGRNHIMLADEPAWPAFLDAVDTFLA